MRNSQSSKANTSLTVTLTPIKESEDEDEDTSVTISFKNLQKSLTIFTEDDTCPIYLDLYRRILAQLTKLTKIGKIYLKHLLNDVLYRRKCFSPVELKLFVRSQGRIKDSNTRV